MGGTLWLAGGRVNTDSRISAVELKMARCGTRRSRRTAAKTQATFFGTASPGFEFRAPKPSFETGHEFFYGRSRRAVSPSR